MPNAIVALTDRLDLLRFCRQNPVFNMTVLGLGDLPRLRTLARRILLIDIDLEDPDKLLALKPVTDATPAALRLILVDRGDHQQEIQARGLGATAVLPRPLQAKDLLALGIKPTRELAPAPAEGLPHPAGARPPRGVADRPEMPSIQAGADLLVSLFAAREPGDFVDMQVVDNVGDQVVAAVSGVGLDRWLTTVRAYHTGTFQHCLLVTGVTAAFGRFLGFGQADLRLSTAAALLHDIGKARIPLEILNKPRRLSDEEFEVMKRHPVIGYDMLVGQPRVPPAVLDGVRHHHEYLDGSGYPDGLASGAIADLTRMLTVVDIYSALIEKRAYKKPRPPSEAMAIIEKLAGEGKIDRALAAALGAMVAGEA
jgi:putative nucleotidyltransferase with HDIG domain